MAPRRFKVVNEATGEEFIAEQPEGMSYEEFQADVQSQFDEKNQEPETGILEAAGLGASQGVTLGFGDEIYGGVGGAYDALTSDKSFGDAYTDRVKRARDALDKARSDRPLVAYGSEVASGLALPFGAIKGAAKIPGLATLSATSRLGKNASLGARTWAGAKEGASVGGLYGFGTGEDGIENRLGSAAGGAVAGGAFGAALPGATDLVRGGANFVTKPFKGYMQPKNTAAEKYVEAIGRDGGDTTSVEGITKALDRLDSHAKMPSHADDANYMLGDMGGSNTKGLIRSAVDMPNDEGSRFGQRLFRRQHKQWERLEDGIMEGMGNSKAFHKNIDDLTNARAAEAKKGFDASFTYQTRMTPEIANVLQRPRVRQLVRQSEDLLGLKDMPIGYETRTEMIDALRRKMYSMEKGAKRAWQSGSQPGAELEMLAWQKARHDLVDAISPQNPTYIKTLKKFSDKSELIDALKEGFDEVKTLPPERLKQTIDALPDDQKQLYRIGAARKIMDEIKKDPTNLDNIKNFSSPDMKERLQVLFPDKKSLNKFQKLLERERKKLETKNEAYGNSKTAKYQKFSEDSGEQASLVVDALSMGKDVLSGNGLGLLRGATNIGRRFRGQTPEVSAETLRYAQRPAAQGVPREFYGAAQGIARRSNPQEYDRALRSGRAGYSAGYESVNDPDEREER